MSSVYDKYYISWLRCCITCVRLFIGEFKCVVSLAINAIHRDKVKILENLYLYTLYLLVDWEVSLHVCDYSLDHYSVVGLQVNAMDRDKAKVSKCYR